MGKMSTKEKKALVMLGVIMAYMLLQPVHGLGMEYAFMIVPLVAFFRALIWARWNVSAKYPLKCSFL